MPERIVTLPSGKQTIVNETPEGVSFPYIGELTGKDLAWAQNFVQTGSQAQANQSSAAYGGTGTPAWYNSGAGPNAYLRDQNQNINTLGAANTAELQRLQREQERIFGLQNGLNVQNQNYIVGLQNNAGWLAGQNNELSNRAWQNADQANAADQAALGKYTEALNAATAFDWGNYGQTAQAVQNARAFDQQNLGALQAAYGQTKILQAGGYGPDVVSQAATARADPAAIQAQYQALGQLQGAANGTLNQTSRAAQAYADAGDIANQQNAANQLQAIANGSKDVSVGEGDPVAYASALNALQKYTDLTNPEVTAQERFIYEQARLRQEQDDRANRGAVMSNMRQRGVSGSGMELTDLALASQRTSQNRLLSDLGAQANAIARSQNSLAGQAQLSSALNAQGNAVAVGNADRQAQAQQAAYAAYANLRAQGFSEEYARGQAADIMATANADRQLNAMNMSGGLASNMRQQSFNEDFSRKSAADSVAMFNKEQSQISQRWQEQYAANQQTDAWNRSMDVFNSTNTVGRNAMQDEGMRNDAANRLSTNFATNSGNLFNGTAYVNNNTANRNTNAINSVGQLNANTVRGWEGVANAGMNANNIQSGTYAQQLAAMTQLGQVGMQNNTNMTQLRNQALVGAQGAAASDRATQAAKQQADEADSFRFGLGGNRGLLGGNLIPGVL